MPCAQIGRRLDAAVQCDRDLEKIELRVQVLLKAQDRSRDRDEHQQYAQLHLHGVMVRHSCRVVKCEAGIGMRRVDERRARPAQGQGRLLVARVEREVAASEFQANVLEAQDDCADAENDVVGQHNLGTAS